MEKLEFMTTALSTVYTILVPALDILCCLHLHRLNLSSFSSPIHHNYYHIYFVEYHWDCSRPAVISDPTLLGDIFIIPVYGTFLLWTLVNLRRGFGVGYFHVKPVPELIDADSAWDIFMSSRFLSLSTRNQRGIFSYKSACEHSRLQGTFPSYWSCLIQWTYIFWNISYSICELAVIIINFITTAL